MEFKGTKGKWEYHGGDNNSIDIVLPDDTTISIDRQSRYTGEYVISRENMEANALLISKAPEMLEMLKYISKGFDDSKKHLILKKVKQLIKEATEL